MLDILQRALVLTAAEFIISGKGRINIRTAEEGELQPDLRREELQCWVEDREAHTGSSFDLRPTRASTLWSTETPSVSTLS